MADAMPISSADRNAVPCIRYERMYRPLLSMTGPFPDHERRTNSVADMQTRLPAFPAAKMAGLLQNRHVLMDFDTIGHVRKHPPVNGLPITYDANQLLRLVWQLPIHGLRYRRRKDALSKLRSDRCGVCQGMREASRLPAKDAADAIGDRRSPLGLRDARMITLTATHPSHRCVSCHRRLA
jgi:hypothetical protein